MGEATEGLKHGLADDQRFDHVGAQRGERLEQSDLATAPVVGRAVGHGKHLGRHASVIGDQFGQLGHAGVVGLAQFNQLEQNLRHGRQPRYQQAIANVLVSLRHGGGSSDTWWVRRSGPKPEGQSRFSMCC